MKNNDFRGVLVACFGQAKIMRRSDGWYELLGGQPEDRSEAREWASLFLHEAVLGDSQNRFTIRKMNARASN